MQTTKTALEPKHFVPARIQVPSPSRPLQYHSSRIHPPHCSQIYNTPRNTTIRVPKEERRARHYGLFYERQDVGVEERPAEETA